MIVFMMMFGVFHLMFARTADLGENRLCKNAEEESADDGERYKTRVDVPGQLPVDGFEHEKDAQAEKQ